MVELLELFGGHVVVLAVVAAHLLGGQLHFGDEVIGINHRALARFHLAVGEFDHAIGKVIDLVGPVESQLGEDELEHFEVIVLLVTHHIDELVGVELIVAQERGAEVLGHIDGGAVAAEQQFLVEAVGGEVAPHGAVLFAEKDTHVETFLHQLFAQQVGVGLIVYLVKAYTHFAVGLVEAGIDPVVHLGPEVADFLVALFPTFEHLLCFEHERGLLLGLFLLHALRHELAYLLFIVFVELDVVFAHKVVAFHAAAFGCFAVAVAQPSKHGFADVDAAVVDEVHLLDIGTVGFEQAAHRPAQQVVADVSQMEGLVGVGRRIFHHDGFGAGQCLAEAVGGVGSLAVDEIGPVAVGHREVEETFDDVVARYLGHGLADCRAQLVAHLLRRLARLFDVWEHHHGIVPFEFFLGGLEHHCVGSSLDAIKSFESGGNCLLKIILYHKYLYFPSS